MIVTRFFFNWNYRQVIDLWTGQMQSAWVDVTTMDIVNSNDSDICMDLENFHKTSLKVQPLSLPVLCCVGMCVMYG